MIRKLRLKFIISIMVIVAIMLTAIFAIQYRSVQENLEDQADSLLRSILLEPIRAAYPERPGGEFTLPFFVLQLDHNGTVLSADGGFYDLSDESILQELAEAVEASGQDTGKLSDYNLRFCKRWTPIGIMIAFCDMANERNALNEILRSFAIAGSISMLLFLGIGIVFSKWAVRPVEKAWNEQRQFVADASHELKTPLTVIMTNAELLQSPDFDEESREQFADSILIMSKQMRGLVEKMLELARADCQKQAVSQTNVDLSRLADEAQLTFEGVFYEKGLTFASEIAPGVTVMGNLSALRQVLDILLDNAQKYSAPGGRTTLSLTAAHGKCRLSVASPGAEISRADLKNIFSRFYRIDSSRSRDGSYGLGLPIAKQIVSQHHGKIWAESSGGINTFLIELPAAQSK